MGSLSSKAKIAIAVVLAIILLIIIIAVALVFALKIKDIQDKQSQDKIELLNAIDANRNLIIANQETIDILHLAPIGEFALSF